MEENRMIKGSLVGTNKEPFIVEFEDTLNNLQAFVGGRIEVLSIKCDEKSYRSIDLIFNEEYEFLFDEVNRTLIYKNGYVINVKGNILVVAADESTGEFVSLTEEELNYYMTFMLDDKLFI